MQAWAIAISATILQNQLHTHLPPAFRATIPPGHDLAYSAIPAIATLPRPLQAEVRAAFAAGFRAVWRVLLGFCGAGLLSVVLQKQVALHEEMDERWGMVEREEAAGAMIEAGMKGEEDPGKSGGEKEEVTRVSVCEVGHLPEAAAAGTMPTPVVSPPE